MLQLFRGDASSLGVSHRCKTVWEARAPWSGVVLYVCAVPSMKKGETVANIGVVAGKAP